MKTLAVIFALVLTGCIPPSIRNQTTPEVTLDVVLLAKIPPVPKPSGSEVALLSQFPSARQYEEVAIVAATTDTGTFTRKNFNSMLPSIQAKACELGADAIVIKSFELGDAPIWNQYNSRTPSKAFCVFIKFLK
ncbi:hypothetical protein [Geothrix fuzhouensis]|uniref:hypothetical protein n=1 Tax=Geothrix fuzhouensis TaxID=2966451 RepID=UPI0021493996|nr:hypothetical protein [Geothrix fuzhouensis]